MPRTKRFLLPKSFYHIMARGNNQSIVFRSNKDYQYYLDLIAKYKFEHPFDLYHYCLMSNHVHFLIQTKKASDFSSFMKKISLAYFYHYKREYGWVGHFWQDRFKSQTVGKDSYFIQCGKYIELNPVRAKIVEDPNNYLFSSYQYYAKGKPNYLITPDFIYCEMNKNNTQRQKQYQQLTISQLVKGAYAKSVWGSNRQRYKEQDKLNRKVKYQKSRTNKV